MVCASLFSSGWDFVSHWETDERPASYKNKVWWGCGATDSPPTGAQGCCRGNSIKVYGAKHRPDHYPFFISSPVKQNYTIITWFPCDRHSTQILTSHGNYENTAWANKLTHHTYFSINIFHGFQCRGFHLLLYHFKFFFNQVNCHRVMINLFQSHVDVLLCVYSNYKPKSTVQSGTQNTSSKNINKM